MARRTKNKTNHDQLPTLNKNVPHLVAWVILSVLFLVVIKIVRHTLGVDF